jgi:hypothetical protein
MKSVQSPNSGTALKYPAYFPEERLNEAYAADAFACAV